MIQPPLLWMLVVATLSLGFTRLDAKGRTTTKVWAKGKQVEAESDAEATFYKLVHSTRGLEQAAALISSSGWSNDGHIALLKKRRGTELYFAQPNRSEFKLQRRLGNHTLEQLAAYKDLGDYDEGAFDGMRYYWLEVSKKSGRWTLTRKVFMNNPQLDKKSRHAIFVSTVQKLRGESMPVKVPAAKTNPLDPKLPVKKKP